MSTSELTSNLANVPASREHMNSTSICCRSDGTFPILSDPMRIYIRGDVTIRYVNNVYYLGNRAFELKDNKLYINGIWSALPSRTEISTIDRLMLSLGMLINFHQLDQTFDMAYVSVREIMSRFTTMALRDLGILRNMDIFKLYKYGEVVFDTYLKALNGSGRIHSKDSSMRWLNEADTLQLKAKLFSARNHSYQAGVQSMQYAPTELADKVFDTTLTLLLSIDFEENDIEFCPLDFIVPITLIREIRLRDTMLLLGDCIGYNNGFVIRPIITDNQFSRVYSVFTSISSETRKKLGFINYDIGSALQTISLQLVKDPSKYPLHQQLVNDRNAFRRKIAEEVNEDIAWVKQELTSADNRDKMPKQYESIPTLKAYFEEALILRKEVIDSAEPQLLERAMAFAKPIWKKVWDANKKVFQFIDTQERKESSVFFFIWTQWERQIREVMMSCFSNPRDCHQVHDAIYSREDIDPSVIEATVLEQTGFKVSISKD